MQEWQTPQKTIKNKPKYSKEAGDRSEGRCVCTSDQRTLTLQDQSDPPHKYSYREGDNNMDTLKSHSLSYYGIVPRSFKKIMSLLPFPRLR